MSLDPSWVKANLAIGKLYEYNQLKDPSLSLWYEYSMNYKEKNKLQKKQKTKVNKENTPTPK